MASDSRLENLREMDPVIGTFTIRELEASPDFVQQVYLGHAETHMSMGDTSKSVDALLKWTKKNKGAVVGAISGEYGYGKTSIGIHLWHELEQEDIIAIPPFEWVRLQDIVDATWSWVRFRIRKIKPSAVDQIDKIYQGYREKTIQEFADDEGISVSKVTELVDRNKVKLQCNPEDVIDFLTDVSKFLAGKELGLYGPIVFTDELQVTMSRYLAEKRSRDEFMQDLFELANSLVSSQGSFGIIFIMPTSTETLINDIRRDIQQRFQYCNIFIRPNSLYKRDFPRELWKKFSDVYKFEDIADIILPKHTIDSIGQIAFREDLGAGPRTVIEAMRYAIECYDRTGQGISPIDLMDAYLSKNIAYDSGGKLVEAVSEVLQSKHVEQQDLGDQVIKLMSAFPMGCPEEMFGEYGLRDEKDELSKKIYTEYLFKFSEGVSLRGLASTERGSEPRFIELTKNYIQTYAESSQDIEAAISAFEDLVVRERVLESRRADQIEGWILDSAKANQYIGTFIKEYPERRLYVRTSSNLENLQETVDEFGLAFCFDTNCTHETCGNVEFLDDEGTSAIFQLNLFYRSSGFLNIPYIEELGYPVRKVSPAFMLGLAQYLQKNENIIPEDEKRTQLPTLLRSLIDYSVQLLFNEEIISNAEIKGLSKVGLSLIQEVFHRMCRLKYKGYQTLITTGRWKRNYSTYINALSSSKVVGSVGILRGNRPFELQSRQEAMALFGENRAQAVTSLVTNIPDVLDVKFGGRDDPSPSKIWFHKHPAEKIFMDVLQNSEYSIERGQVSLKTLDQHKGFDLLKDLGYREEEIAVLFNLLKCRKLIDFDSEKQLFVEVLESPEERREAILSALSDLTEQADDLMKIPDFDQEWFLAESTQLSDNVMESEDIEKLEEYQSELSKLREQLTKFSKDWATKIEKQFDEIRLLTSKVVKQTIPSDLSKTTKGDVGWVGELVECQILLKGMFKKSIGAFRDLENKVSSAWSVWEGASPNDAKALVVLYDSNLGSVSELDEAQNRLATAKGYLESYVAWSNVLNSASRAYSESLNCENSYSEGKFRKNLDKVFIEISTSFNKKRLETLPDHEIYFEKIRAIQDQIDSWLRNRRDIFMQSKRFYEDTIKAIGIGRYTLHANFDAFDPDLSRSNLINEVVDKTKEFVQSKEQELARHRTEVIYAEQVVNADVSLAESKIDKASKELAESKKEMNFDCIKDEKRFENLGVELSKLNDSIVDVEKSLKGILKKRKILPNEQIIFDLLNDPKGTDLGVVIAKQLEADADKFSLDEIMQHITSLFKKNQVIISIWKRR